MNSFYTIQPVQNRFSGKPPRMEFFRLLYCLFALLLAVGGQAYAQTGPGGVGNAGGTGGQPANKLWLRADLGVFNLALPATDNQKVTQWNDQSGNGLHGTQITLSNQPVFRTNILNGRPVLRFNMSEIMFANNALDGSSILPMSFFAVAANSTGNPKGLFDSAPLVSNAFRFYNDGSSNPAHVNNRVEFWDDNPSLPYTLSSTGTVVGVEGTMTSGGSPKRTLTTYNNGTINSVTATGGSANNPVVMDEPRIGTINHNNTSAITASNIFYVGDIGEVIYYSTALNTAQKTIVQNYLGAKYNIPLAAGVGDYYASTAYREDVIGIGTADGALTDAHTNSWGGALRLSLTGLVSATANSYVIAGHNGTAHGTVAGTTTTGIALTRWAREYWFESTGAKPNISIGFDFAAAGQAINPAANYVLLYRATTGTANFTEVVVTPSISGSVVSFSVPAATLATTGLYTLGIKPPPTTLYTFNTNCNGTPCDWNTASSWTTDPTGTFSVGAQQPNSNTNLVILPGATVRVNNNNMPANIVTIQSGGTLDLAATTGHNYNQLDGAGWLKITAANGTTNAFPVINNNIFITTSGSTVEYYGTTSYNIIGSVPEYTNLVISGGGTKTMLNSILVAENLTVEASSTFQQSSVSLNVYGITYVSGTMSDNNAAGTASYGDVVIYGAGTFNMELGTHVFGGTVTVHGMIRDSNVAGSATFDQNVTVTNTGTFNLEQGNFTANAITTVSTGGTLIDSHANGINSFNDLVVSGILNNSVNSAVAIRGNLTVNSTASFTSGTGLYTLSGASKLINGTASGFTLGSVAITGTYTNSIPNLVVNSGEVAAGAKLTNANTIVPANYTDFNNALTWPKGFNALSATGAGSRVNTSGNRTLALTRAGAGNSYVVKTTDFAPASGAVIIRFDMSVTGATAATNAATLLAGTNFTDDATYNTAAARLRFDLTGATNFTVTQPDGAATGTSGGLTNSNSIFWAVNTTATSVSYWAPNGSVQTLPGNAAHLWTNTGQVGTNLSITTAGVNVTDLKFIFDNGSATINFNNVRVNPISAITLTPTAPGPFCVSPVKGSATFNLSFSMPPPATAATHFNPGNTFTAQLSAANGVFSNNPTVIGTLTTTLLSGTIPVSIPANTPSGTQYRVRIVSSDPRLVSNDNGTNITVNLYSIVNSNGAPQQTLTVGNPASGVPVNVNGPLPITSYSWGYRDVSGGTIKKFISCNCFTTGSTYTPNPNDFPGKGLYYLVLTITTPTCTIETNEIEIAINCANTLGINMISNPGFDSPGYTYPGTAAQMGFSSQYNWVTQPASKCNGGTVGCPMYPEGTYSIGTNPRFYHTNFCDLDVFPPPAGIGGNMLIANAATTGSLDVWAQDITVEKNTDYVFTFWATNLNSASPLQFGIYINCFQVGIPVTNPASKPCEWMKYSIQWNSGNNTVIKLSVRNISVNASGNDITMDNFEFYKCTDAPAFAPTYPYKWRGLTNEWNKADNWGNCVPPTCADSVDIVAGTPFQPVIPSGVPAAAKHIVIQPGASLTLNANATLNVCGNLLNMGSISASATSHITFSNSENPQWVSGNFTGSNRLGRVTINKGAATQVFRLDSDVDMAGTFTITQGAVNANGRTLRLGGDFSISNTASFAHGNGTVEFNGIVNQNFVNSSTAPSGEFFNLFLNQGVVSTVTPNGSNIIVNNQLRLGSGKLFPHISQSREVIVRNTASNAIVAEASNPGYVNSYVVTTPSISPRLRLRRYVAGVGLPISYDFPVGTANDIELMRMTLTSNPQVGYLTAYFDNANASTGSGLPLTDLDGKQYIAPCTGGFWDLTPDAPGNNTTYNMELFPVGFNCNGNQSTLLKRSNSGSAWTFDTSTPVGIFSRNNYKGFSQFVPGYNNIILPVRMVYFDGWLSNNVTELKWQTATEEGSDYFTVQRSTDGINFTAIGRVKAAGYSSKSNTYHFTDYQPQTGINYYRLMQKDVNGKEVYSKVINVQLEKTGDIQVYPNPVDEHIFNVVIPAATGEKIEITMIDMLGKTVHTDQFEFKGETYTVDKNMAQGVYILTVRTQFKTYTRKVIVQ